MDRKRVLIVDDSALVRKLLTELLSEDPAIEVVGAATDPYDAREKIKALDPDVLTLDVEMPRMDGVTFLGNLMRLRPMPVVMISSLTEQGADVTLRALELGAVDFVAKPKMDVQQGLEHYAQEIRDKVKAAAAARPRIAQLASQRLARTGTDGCAGVSAHAAMPRHFRTTDTIIAIGASTGGTEAIREVIARFPAHAPPVVITQHIPAAFSGPFAARLDSSSAMTVREAQHGDVLLPGHAFVAPGDWHLEVVRDGARYVCRLSDAPPVNRHRPSVDVMFGSLARNAGANCVAVLLTGMGQDGATGMVDLHAQGARTFCQDERTSVVWGMPGEAVKRGAADHVLPLDAIAGEVLKTAAGT